MTIGKESRFWGAELEIRAVTDEGGKDVGGFSGYANLTEVKDEYNSIFKRGCYKNLDKLVRDGFIAEGHNWGVLGVGYITKAEERERGLWIEVQFHGDAESQQVRQKISERIAAGKSVSLSIGFFTLADAVETIDGEEVRIIKEVDVREVSIVNVPGTPGSQIDDVRGVTANAQYADVLGAVGVLLDRFDQIAGLRKGVSEGRKAEALELADKLDELSARARAFAAPDDTETQKDDVPADSVPDNVLAELRDAFSRMGEK